jgi:hypothetical protein
MQTIYGVSGLDTLTQDEQQSLVVGAVSGLPAVTVVGTTGAASVTLTAMGSLAGVAVGATIVAPGVTPGTTVEALDDAAHTVTMSAVSIGAHAGENILFINPPGALSNLGGCVIALVAAAPGVPPNQLTFGDLTIATFTGYSESDPVVWGLPLIDANKDVFITGDKKQFRATGTAVGNSIFGAAYVDPGLTTLYCYDAFLDVNGNPFQVEIDVAGAGLDYVPLFRFPNGPVGE